LIIYVDGRLVPRPDARVSVFDASFQSGDAVWEGIRVYDGRVFELDAHLTRLYDSAKALAIEIPLSRAELTEAIFSTLQANQLYTDTHMRLMVSRGERRTSGMDPRNISRPGTVVIIAEHKPPVYGKRGIRLVTSSVRRPAPDTLDPRIHHANQLNSILAKIEANRGGVDDALMLDQRGFVAETATMNVFIVKAGALATPFTTACLEGLTRALVLREARAAGLQALERDISLLEVHTADEVFATGTAVEIVPVVEVDGRVIGSGTPGPITQQVAGLYRALTDRHGVRVPGVAVGG
jgi:branched-chain amino acid aminotransferase